jgi:hypothetical protein
VLFKQETLSAIAAGEVTLAFRRWRRPSVKAGGTLRTTVGVLAIDVVEVVAAESITEAEARRAGPASRAALLKDLSRRDGDVYRIAFHRVGGDPRIALREQAALDSDDLAEVLDALRRLDRASRRGAWAAEVLRLIADNPGRRAPDLAAGRGEETLHFKRAVRKLKALGLTESLSVGYRISPRGQTVLAALELERRRRKGR